MLQASPLIRGLASLLLAAAAGLALIGSGRAQDWPTKPVRILVPYAAGGNSDSMARITAQRLSERFGQQFVVENRLGANGAIASEAVARATPDGYTLLWGVQPPIVIFPAMTKVTYDSQKDFAPISVVGTNAFVLVVNKNVPVNNIAEFIAWVKAQPTKLSYAEGSLGSVTHLSMALFLKRAGLEMTNVSYRGNAPALTDVIAGHLPTMFSNLSDALPHAQSGAIRMLAVSSETRLPQTTGRADRRRARLSGLQGRDLEWLDGAGGDAQADHRPTVSGNRARQHRSAVRRATEKLRRRSLGDHAGSVRSVDRGRPEALGGGCDHRRRQAELTQADRDTHG